MHVNHRSITITFTNADPNNNTETNYEILENVETNKIEEVAISDKYLRIQLDIIRYSK